MAAGRGDGSAASLADRAAVLLGCHVGIGNGLRWTDRLHRGQCSWKVAPAGSFIEYGTLVQDSLTSAFSMAADAHTALSTNPLGTNVAALAGFVFGTGPYDHATQVFENITTNLNTGISTNRKDPTQVVWNYLYMYRVVSKLIRTDCLL